MAAHKNFKTRVGEARAAAKFVRIMSRNSKGQATSVSVPGHQGKTYLVIIRRFSGKISTECLLETGFGTKPCPGTNSVCYHSMAAIMAVAKDAGVKIFSFHIELYGAKKLHNINRGMLIELFNRIGTDKIWVVAK